MKKWWVLLSLILLMGLSGIGYAANTAVMVGNRIIIAGDAVADDGDFDVWTNLVNAAGTTKGWSPGSHKVTILGYCWFGDAIAVADVLSLETADAQLIGPDLIATVADETLCIPDIHAVVDRLYVDQLSHGTIIIYLEP